MGSNPTPRTTSFTYVCARFQWTTNTSVVVDVSSFMAGLPSSLGTLEKNGVGLDPAIGFLHDLAESKEPLVCDLQELFRWLAACQ
ncbi:hypothetical protein NVIE_2460 [Nitrososphaera viennensis EN76]|uniref:Uncharacterized protein n=2 Tax=Nitrososphaera viennensis TaxID=1034015 RepID=A0A060HT53_9ARCH|nr:hypothetical protein NVIE_2460 [Nitrososphaera viennensis EN76]